MARSVQLRLRALRRQQCRKCRRPRNTGRPRATPVPHHSAARGGLSRAGRRMMRLSAGTHTRLGATWDGRGTNFALFSANAQSVELRPFDNQGRREIERITLPERTEDVWHGYLNDNSPGQLYGYRVHGPFEPEHGHRFNCHKLQNDPYAKRHSGRPRDDLSFVGRVNARGLPKAVVIDEAFNWGRRENRPNVALADAVIYEAHVKGLTQARHDVPAQMRGT